MYESMYLLLRSNLLLYCVDFLADVVGLKIHCLNTSLAPSIILSVHRTHSSPNQRTSE